MIFIFVMRKKIYVEPFCETVPMGDGIRILLSSNIGDAGSANYGGDVGGDEAKGILDEHEKLYVTETSWDNYSEW